MENATEVCSGVKYDTVVQFIENLGIRFLSLQLIELQNIRRKKTSIYVFLLSCKYWTDHKVTSSTVRYSILHKVMQCNTRTHLACIDAYEQMRKLLFIWSDYK